MLKRLLLIAALALLPFSVRAEGAAPKGEPIRIGVLNSITGLPSQARPFQNGLILAIDEINAKGGVLGRPLELVIRDDKNSPTDATREAARLDQGDKVSMLVGTFLDNVGQAVLNYAGQAKIPFLKPTGATDIFVWQEGNRYSFRNDASTDTLGHMLANEAAKNPAKRWAVIAPNYEYGHAMYAAFKRHMAKLRPDVVWVAEQFPSYNKINAGSVVQIVNRAKPDAILALIFGDDIVKFNREAKKRDLLQSLYYVAPYMGWPETLGIFKQETPVGWLTQGFPYLTFKDEKLKGFVKMYENRFKEPPGATSMNGYTTGLFAAAAIARAGSTDREKITDAFSNLSIDTPMGKLTMRGIDHQSNYGAWVGKTGFIGDTPTILDWRYEDATSYFPSDSVVRTLRPAKGN